MYSLKIHKRAVRFFKSRSNSERKLIKVKLDLLVENPYSHPQLDIKRLKGIEEVFRLRIGKIRIIYLVRNSELLILIISAGTKGDIYKNK